MLRKQLYRTLLKQSIKMDKAPRMKAFVFTTEATFGYEDKDLERVMNKGTADKAMDDLVRGFCEQGSFYKPEKSLAQYVKSTFRHPPAELNENQLHQLGFMAIRQLFNCAAIAKSLTIPQESPFESKDNIIVAVEPATGTEFEPFVPAALLESASTGPVTITEINAPEVGSVLVSHPLRTEDSFSSSVMLVTHVSDNHSSGLILNRDFKDNFKSRLSKNERVRYGAYLKHFYEMPCFYGGYEYGDRQLNFSILHQQDSLAHVSTRIDLSNPGEVMASTSSTSSSTGSEEAHALSTAEEKNYVYVSHDFRAVGEQIAAGNVRTQDLKLVQGEITWPEQELQETLRANKFFALRSSAAGHIVMLPPAPASFEDPQYVTTWARSDVWYSGQYAWSKLLVLMGGEYRDFARLQRIISAEHAKLYLLILPTLPGFDLKEPPREDSDFEDYDSDDSEMDQFERALQVVSDLSENGYDLDGLTLEFGDLLEEGDDSDDDEGDM